MYMKWLEVDALFLIQQMFELFNLRCD